MEVKSAIKVSQYFAILLAIANNISRASSQILDRNGTAREIVLMMQKGYFIHSFFKRGSGLTLKHVINQGTEDLALEFLDEQRDEKLANLFCCEGSVLSSYYNRVLYFFTHHEANFFKRLKMMMHLMDKFYWYPLTIFMWPYSINSTNHDASFLWKEVVWSILVTKVVSIIHHHQVGIQNSIYFVFKIQNDQNEIKNSVWEVYYINGFHKERNLVIQEISFGHEWVASHVQRRGDLRKTTLSTVAPFVFDTNSELHWKEIDNGTWKLSSGYSLEILQDLAASLNFRFVIFKGDWLSHGGDKKVDGVSATMLENNLVDLLIGHSVPLLNRTVVLDYVHPTSKHSLRAYFQQPPANSIRNIITSAFRPPLFTLVVLMYFILFVSIRVVSITSIKACNWQQSKASLIHFDSQGFSCWSEALIWIFGTISQQGPRKFPSSTTFRIIFITTTLTALTFYISYQAVVVSVLSLEELPIKNLAQLISSDIPVYASDDSVVVNQYVKVELISKKSGKTVRYVPVDLGVKMIFYEGHNSYIIYAHQFYHEMQNQKIPDHLICDRLYHYPLTNVPLPSAMAVPKNSQFKKFFNYRILGMAEHGLIHRYMTRRDIGNGVRDCLQPATRYRNNLGLEDIISVFFILSIGFAACCICLALECFYSCNNYKIKMLFWFYRHKFYVQ